MVATDGHRLALVEKEQSFARLTTEVRLLIPKRTLDALYRVVAEAAAEASISITSDQRHMFFSVGYRLLISRLLTGTFPNYDSVLPRENNKILELDRDQVRAALRRVSLLASVQSNAVRPRTLGTHRARWSSLNRSELERPELLMRLGLAALRVGQRRPAGR